MRVQKKLCCSKKMVVVSWCVTISLTVLTVIGAFFTERDTSPLLTVAGLSWGETATATGFYYWKSRAENRLKLTKSMVEEWAEKYGIDSVVSLVGIIFRD
jgi:hypothetical protein